MNTDTFWLSRVQLRPTPLVADAYEIHRTIAHAFPDDGHPNHRSHNGILWLQQDDGLTLIVQSLSRPDWEAVARNSLESHDTKPLPTNLRGVREGRTIRFVLKASPQRSKGRDWVGSQRTRGVKRPIRQREDRLDWLATQGQQYGFEFDPESVRVVDVPPVLGRRKNIRYTPCRFDGILSITESEPFCLKRLLGYGPGKAFGLGLMIVGTA